MKFGTKLLAIGWLGLVATAGFGAGAKVVHGWPKSSAAKTGEAIVVGIEGEVKAPGKIKFHAPAFFQDALRAAGGVTELAKSNSIVLMRANSDGSGTIYRFDPREAERQHATIPLQDRDIIYVPLNCSGP